ncbi:TPA: hypothetical protein ACM99T_004657, partial [Escherichia coli]
MSLQNEWAAIIDLGTVSSPISMFIKEKPKTHIPYKSKKMVQNSTMFSVSLRHAPNNLTEDEH